MTDQVFHCALCIVQVTNELAGLVADVGMREYEQRMSTLRTLVQLWTQNEQVAVVRLSGLDQDDADPTDADEAQQIDRDEEDPSDPDPTDEHEAEHVHRDYTDPTEDEAEQVGPGAVPSSTIDEHEAEQLGLGIAEPTDQSGQSSKRLKLPPAVKRRGRPKGCHTTVIGLPKAKRARKTLLPFTELSPVEQQSGM